MSTIPDVRIMFSDILYQTVSVEIQKAKSRDGFDLASIEQCNKWTHDYRAAWKPKAHTILEGMCKLYGLEFYRDVIDVNLAPWIKPISKPIMMSFFYEPDQFVDILTHELLHVLQTDNKKIKYQDSRLHDVRAIWVGQFGDTHSFKTLVHIPIHAGLKAIYLDILKEPERLERDIKACEHMPEYKLAWEYVEKHDYKKIINNLKDAYSHL